MTPTLSDTTVEGENSPMTLTFRESLPVSKIILVPLMIGPVKMNWAYVSEHLFEALSPFPSIQKQQEPDTFCLGSAALG